MAAKKKTRKRASRKSASKAGKRPKTKKKAGSRGPGRRLSEAEQTRRLDALHRHGSKDSPEPLTAQKIADKLEINVGTWNVWKSNQKARGARATARRGRPTKQASSLDAVIEGFRGIERDRDQLRKVIESIQRAVAEIP